MGNGRPMASLPWGGGSRVWAQGSGVLCPQGRIIECTHCGCRGCSG